MRDSNRQPPERSNRSSSRLTARSLTCCRPECRYTTENPTECDPRTGEVALDLLPRCLFVFRQGRDSWRDRALPLSHVPTVGTVGFEPTTSRRSREVDLALTTALLPLIHWPAAGYCRQLVVKVLSVAMARPGFLMAWVRRRQRPDKQKSPGLHSARALSKRLYVSVPNRWHTLQRYRLPVHDQLIVPARDARRRPAPRVLSSYSVV